MRNGNKVNTKYYKLCFCVILVICLLASASITLLSAQILENEGSLSAHADLSALQNDSPQKNGSLVEKVIADNKTNLKTHGTSSKADFQQVRDIAKAVDGKDTVNMSDEDVQNYAVLTYISFADSLSNDDTDILIADIEQITSSQVEYRYTLINTIAIKATLRQIPLLRELDGVVEIELSNILSVADESANQLQQVGSVYQNYALDGEGVVVAIIDSGIQANHKDLRLSNPNSAKISLSRANQKISEFGHGVTPNDINGNPSVKVPYSYNYADRSNATDMQYDTYKDPSSGRITMHGMHVGGIVAANGENPDDITSVRGVAPEAQLLNMKVFSNFSAHCNDASVIKAIEDAVKLGADVINMSLGSYSMNSQNYGNPMMRIIDNVAKLGILTVTAAGNSGIMSATSDGATPSFHSYINATSRDIEQSSVGSPSIAHYALSVANMQAASLRVDTADVQYKCYEKVDSRNSQECTSDTDVHNVDFNLANNNGVFEYSSNSIFKDTTGRYMSNQQAFTNGAQLYLVPEAGVNADPSQHLPADLQALGWPGYGGDTADYPPCSPVCSGGALNNIKQDPNINKEKKIIALISRGGAVKFTDKIYNAQVAGANGVIIIDNEPNSQQPLTTSDGSNFEDSRINIPMMFISYEDGKKLVEIANTLKNALPTQTHSLFKFTASQDKRTIPNPGLYSMDDSTSWGPTPQLQLKPEISGTGGNIWSLANDNSYKNMTGTSMSSPTLAGCAALMIQKMKQDHSPKLGTLELVKTIKQRMENTAMPLTDKSYQSTTSGHINTSPYYSPRRQGSGLVQMLSAIDTPTTLKTDSEDGIFNLGEISSKTATFTGEIDNDSNDPIEYNFRDYGGVQGEVRVETGDTVHEFDPNPSPEYGWNNYVGMLIPADVRKVETVHSDYINGANIIVDKGVTFSVPAHSSLPITITITLPDALAFPENNWVEGFIGFEPTDSTLPTISAPYFGYYGDYYSQHIIDSPVYCQSNISQYNYNIPWSNAKSLQNTNMSCPRDTSSSVGYFMMADPESGVITQPGYFETGKSNGQSSRIGMIDPTGQIFAQNANHSRYVEFSYGLYRHTSSVEIDIVDSTKNNVVHRLYRDVNAQIGIFFVDWDGQVYNSRTGKNELVPNGQYYFRVKAVGTANTRNSVETNYFPIRIVNNIDTLQPKIIETKYRESTKAGETGIFKTYVHVKVDSPCYQMFSMNMVSLNINGISDFYSIDEMEFPNGIDDRTDFWIEVGYGHDQWLFNGANTLSISVIDPLMSYYVSPTISWDSHADYVSRFGASYANNQGGKLDSGVMVYSYNSMLGSDESVISAFEGLDDYCLAFHSTDWTRGDCEKPEQGISSWVLSRFSKGTPKISWDTTSNSYKLNIQGNYFENLLLRMVDSGGNVLDEVSANINENHDFYADIKISQSSEKLEFYKADGITKAYHDFPILFSSPTSFEIDESMFGGLEYKVNNISGSYAKTYSIENYDSSTIDVKSILPQDVGEVKAYIYSWWVDSDGVNRHFYPAQDPVNRMNKDITRIEKTDSECSDFIDSLGNPTVVNSSSDYCYKHNTWAPGLDAGLVFDSSQTDDEAMQSGVPNKYADLVNGVAQKQLNLNTLGSKQSFVQLFVLSRNSNCDTSTIHYFAVDYPSSADSCWQSNSGLYVDNIAINSASNVAPPTDNFTRDYPLILDTPNTLAPHYKTWNEYYNQNTNSVLLKGKVASRENLKVTKFEIYGIDQPQTCSRRSSPDEQISCVINDDGTFQTYIPNIEFPAIYNITFVFTFETLPLNTRTLPWRMYLINSDPKPSFDVFGDDIWIQNNDDHYEVWTKNPTLALSGKINDTMGSYFVFVNNEAIYQESFNSDSGDPLIKAKSDDLQPFNVTIDTTGEKSKSGIINADAIDDENLAIAPLSSNSSIESESGVTNARRISTFANVLEGISGETITTKHQFTISNKYTSLNYNTYLTVHYNPNGFKEKQDITPKNNMADTGVAVWLWLLLVLSLLSLSYLLRRLPLKIR